MLAQYVMEMESRLMEIVMEFAKDIVALEETVV